MWKCRSCSEMAAYIRTGTFTRPNEMLPLQIARGTASVPEPALNQLVQLPRDQRRQHRNGNVRGVLLLGHAVPVVLGLPRTKGRGDRRLDDQVGNIGCSHGLTSWALTTQPAAPANPRRRFCSHPGGALLAR